MTGRFGQTRPLANSQREGKGGKHLKENKYLEKENIWSVCSSGCYLVVLGKYKAVMVGTWWYWVRTRRYWLVLCGTGSLEVEGSTACYLVVLGQKRALLVASVICFIKISG